MTPRMLLWRTCRKSATVTLRLMSITASNPSDARSGGGGAIGYWYGAKGTWRGLHPAAVKAVRPERMLLREIMRREYDVQRARQGSPPGEHGGLHFLPAEA